MDYDKSEIETDISVSRESDFTRSGPEMADEVRDSLIILFETVFQIELFNGKDNILTMNQTHSKKFHCIYLLHYYPFDTQVSCQYESSTLNLFTRLAV